MSAHHKGSLLLQNVKYSIENERNNPQQYNSACSFKLGVLCLNSGFHLNLFPAFCFVHCHTHAVVAEVVKLFTYLLIVQIVPSVCDIQFRYITFYTFLMHHCIISILLL